MPTIAVDPRLTEAAEVSETISSGPLKAAPIAGVGWFPTSGLRRGLGHFDLDKAWDSGIMFPIPPLANVLCRARPKNDG
jgi:hypothetical protein